MRPTSLRGAPPHENHTLARDRRAHDVAGRSAAGGTMSSYSNSPPRRSAAFLAALCLFLIALTPMASAVAISPEATDLPGSDAAWLGNQLFMDNGPTMRSENSWNNASNSSDMTFEEVAGGDAAVMVQSIQTSEYSTGDDSEGDASNRSLRTVTSGGLTNGKHGWYDGSVDTVEFDINYANQTSADAISLSWGSRSAQVTHTSSEEMYILINTTANSTGVRIGYYDGTGYTGNVTNTTGYIDNGDWTHVIMSYTENATGSHFLWGIGDAIFTLDTVILGWTLTGNWLLMTQYTGLSLLGNTTLYYDNLAMYDATSTQHVMDILQGNFSTTISASLDSITAIIPIYITITVLGIIVGVLGGIKAKTSG